MGLVIALGFFLLASLLTVLPGEFSPYRLDTFLPMKLYARVAFDSPSEEATRRERDAAASHTPATLELNQVLLTDINNALKNFPQQLQAFTATDQVPADVRVDFGIKPEADLQELRQFAQSPKGDQYQADIAKVVGELSKLVVITSEDSKKDDKRGSAGAFKLARPGGGGSATKSEVIVLDTSDYPALRTRIDDIVAPIDASIRPNIHSYLERVFIPDGRPTYRVNWVKTEADAKEAAAAVPVQTVSYPADSVVFKGGRVTQPDLTVLEAERGAFLASLKDPKSDNYDPNRMIRAGLGRAGLTLLVIVMLCLYVAHYQPRVIRNPWRGLALAVLLLITLGLAELITVAPGANSYLANPYLAVASVMLGAIIITIAYDQRFALAIGTLLAVLTTLSMRMGLGYFLVLETGMAVSVLGLKEIRSRSKVVEVGALAAVCVFIAATLQQLSQGTPLGWLMISNSAWGAGAALMMGFFMQGILPMIERVFRIATSMTLLEWSDPNKKLLRRLTIEAPGTYNHSILLGTLCEAAAEAIGARGLLARVGAYYHDIGKINKPEYFVENQLGSPSKHTKLSPAMSLLIIVGHVKDGIELAREYGLPPVMNEFIASHHGTTLVQYFYHAASEQRRAAGSEAPDEVEFRYPGPKPKSKESAILMLADAVESSVRAMADPTPGRIETQAHSIASQRLMDGQLDECDLTLKDVHEIEKSLIKTLQGIYHGRIAYPSRTPKSDSESETKAARA